jgi:hypothetical protein
MKNVEVQKVMNRYYSKFKEFESKSKEELTDLIKLGIENKLKMSSTDKKALEDVYKKLLHIEMQNKIQQIKEEKEKKENETTKITESNLGIEETTQDNKSSK